MLKGEKVVPAHAGLFPAALHVMQRAHSGRLSPPTSPRYVGFAPLAPPALKRTVLSYEWSASL